MKLDGFLEARVNDLHPTDEIEVLVVVDGTVGLEDARKALEGFNVVEEYPFSRSFLVKATRKQMRELEKKDVVVAINEA